MTSSVTRRGITGLLGPAGRWRAGRDVAAAEGFLPADIVERVNAQRLDTSRLAKGRSLRLRGYRSFGVAVRPQCSWRQVHLGDEMGLGKTIQAIATMAPSCRCGKQRAFWWSRPASV